MIEKKTIYYEEREAHPGKFTGYEAKSEYLECRGEQGCILRLYPISEEIVRVRYSIRGQFQRDFSYGLDDKKNFDSIVYSVSEDDMYLCMSTAAIDVKIDKSDLKLRFLNKDGFVINADEKGFHWEANTNYGGHIVQMTKTATVGEAYYGLGDKTVELNMRGHRFQNWGTDNYGYQKGSDPLYKNIPFYYGLRNGIGYGIFFDNSFEAFFDFGKERSEVTSFWAQGGEMNYYFIAGPELLKVAERYAWLTGTPDLPPFWSLGFQQCKWSYYPESRVREIAETMRSHKIPCDAIYLDIDYMDGFRCFTWDKEKFPEPKKMIDDLSDMGFKTMVIIDPGIKVDEDYPIFTEGLEKGYFCKLAEGEYIEGKVWPGDCYFPDFTNPDAREWWAGLYKELIEELGVAGVWNDMNEPALFEVPSKTFPPNVMHHYEGKTTSHREVHNVYGMQMARATYEGVKRHSNGDRALIITRSGYAGMQRYSSVWTGDNIANWEHLWLADVQAQRLSISGVSFCGSDIGGFIGQPNGELMTRWIALGIFHPFCRVHSSGDHGDQEPWVFGQEYTDLFRRFVELRYELLPYIYTAFAQYHFEGTPMMRPIVFYDQSDMETISRDHEFLMGDHLLVCPVTQMNSEARFMYLPRGTWYYYFDNKKLEGQQSIKIATPIDEIPLFVKAGAIIPHYPVQQYTGESEIKEVTLKVYYGNTTETSEYYEDDHTSYAYENGDYRKSCIEFSGTVNDVTLTQSIEGTYQTKIQAYVLDCIGFPFEIKEAVVDGISITPIDGKISIPSNFKTLVIK